MENLFNFDINAILGNVTFVPALLAIVALVVSAFFAMRMFKVYMCIIGTFSFGFVGYTIASMLPLPTVEGVDLVAVVGLVTALVGLIISPFLHRLVLFVGGVAAGYALGVFVASMIGTAIEVNEIAATIIAAVVALIVGGLAAAIFKPMYIIITSLGGMAVVGVLVSRLIVGVNMTAVIISLIAGAVVGIIPMVYQFNSASEEY